MEGLSNWRPQYLNMLLADCRSVKTKRLFLWFAQRHNHAWFKAIDTAKVNVGKGKRMIVPGGKLDRNYLITVPEEFANDHAQIKIEVTPVLRGTVFPHQTRAVSEKVQDEFGFAEIAVVSFEDLYGGKLVAALDRQSLNHNLSNGCLTHSISSFRMHENSILHGGWRVCSEKFNESRMHLRVFLLHMNP